jgi:hypothetical protein
MLVAIIANDDLIGDVMDVAREGNVPWRTDLDEAEFISPASCNRCRAVAGD